MMQHGISGQRALSHHVLSPCTDLLRRNSQKPRTIVQIVQFPTTTSPKSFSIKGYPILRDPVCCVRRKFRKSLDLSPRCCTDMPSMERSARAIWCVAIFLALFCGANGIGDGVIRRRGTQFVDKNCKEFMYSGWNR